MRKRIILTSLFLIANITLLFAQGDLPGGGCSDPDDPACGVPLDTWVIFLAAVTLIITTLHLHRKAKNNIIIAQ